MAEPEWDEREHEGIEGIISRLPPYFCICTMSCRNSGKSVLMTQLVKELIRLKKVDVVVCMSETAEECDDWKFINTPGTIAATTFDEDKLSRIVQKQREDIYRYKNPPKDGKDKPPKPKHVLLVLDDCLSSPEAIKSQIVQAIFTLGRHRLMSCILISQAVTKFPTPQMRQNMDMCLWSRLNKQTLESLHLCTTNISKEDFIKISETFGGVGYNFMLLDLFNKSSRDPIDVLTVVRANPPDEKRTKKPR